MKAEDANRTKIIAWSLFALLTVAVTRIPFSREYLTLDNVNLAYAMEEFDPWNHQPHPPGYPLFVAETRLINLVFGDARNTLIASSVLAGTACLLLAAALGTRLFSRTAGMIAAALLVFNATFWSASLGSPLRLHLALFSLLTGYCCWRSWNGEKAYAIWGAVVLGVGAGFRPDLVFYLGPLWAISASRGGWQASSKPISTLVSGTVIIAGFMVMWTGILAWSVGGMDRFRELILSYLGGQFRETSELFDTRAQGLFHLTRMMTWNALGVLSWIPALPFALRRRKNPEKAHTALFFLAWIVPGLAIQGMLHAAAPGHTLFAAPVLSLIGGAVLCSAISRARPPGRDILRWAVPVLAVAANVLLFARSTEIGVAIAAWDTGRMTVVSKAVADGFFQTSYGNVRIEDQAARESIQEIQRLLAHDCDVIVAAQGSFQFFSLLNWRIASYYFPEAPIWVLADVEVPPKATLVRGKERLEVRLAPPIVLNVPAGRQIIWLLDPNSGLRSDLNPVISTTSAKAVFSTDLRAVTSTFSAGPFQFAADPELCASPE